MTRFDGKNALVVLTVLTVLSDLNVDAEGVEASAETITEAEIVVEGAEEAVVETLTVVLPDEALDHHRTFGNTLRRKPGISDI